MLSINVALEIMSQPRKTSSRPEQQSVFMLSWQPLQTNNRKKIKIFKIEDILCPWFRYNPWEALTQFSTKIAFPTFQVGHSCFIWEEIYIFESYNQSFKSVCFWPGVCWWNAGHRHSSPLQAAAVWIRCSSPSRFRPPSPTHCCGSRWSPVILQASRCKHTNTTTVCDQVTKHELKVCIFSRSDQLTSFNKYNN